MLRNTLGVGPCQYILQTEGLASEGSPTADAVMTWIEKQFKRKKQKSSADEIRERLGLMVAHVGQAQKRIERYGRLAAEIGGAVPRRAGGRGLRRRWRPSSGWRTGWPHVPSRPMRPSVPPGWPPT